MRRSLLSVLETTIDTSSTHSEGGIGESGDLESRVTITGSHHTIGTVPFIDGDEKQDAEGI